ncbi:MAG: signal peptidase I [Clostridium sp.]|jgi:signal peptidase|nr:signal peptidase I [Clostridium sp.]
MPKNSTKPEKPTGARKVLHIVATVIGAIICILLIPIITVNLTLVVKSYQNPDEVPTFAGYAPLIVKSGSMSPAIEVDDLIFTKTVDTSTLKVGDVIGYTVKNSSGGVTVITHKIIAIEESGTGETLYRTKGDANNTQDESPVYPNQVLGLYFYRIAGAGVIADFMSKPLGMVLFVAIPLVLFLMYDVIRRMLFNKQEKAKQAQLAQELEMLRKAHEASAAQSENAPVASTPPQE